MTRGLVVEGGGFRVLFAAGVMDVMMEHGIRFDKIVGVSAGAAFGCNYLSGQIGRAIRYNKNLCGDSRYMGLKSMLTTGDWVNGEFAFHTVPETIDIFDKQAFEKNPAKFYAVVTDVRTGLAEYKHLERIDYEGLEWIRASSSMPLVARPVKIDGGLYLDGGISDSIPLEFLENEGIDRSIVILSREKGYRKGAQKMKWLVRLLLKNIPMIYRAMVNRQKMYNRQLEHLEQAVANHRALAIYPPRKIEIGRIENDRDKMEAVYRMGREEALRRIEQIKEFLNE